MKKYAMLFMAVFAAAIFFTSCEEEENQTINDPYQRIEGKWNMEKYVQRGDPMMELDGSYWNLMYNDTTEAPYMGVDSLTTWGSSGTFEYEFSADEDTLVVIDQNQNGGYYHGNWLIQEFTDKALLLTREYDEIQYGDTLQFSRN